MRLLSAHSRHFNPRSPHGERQRKPPAAHQPPEISIHAPRTGSDKPVPGRKKDKNGFQSTLPARGATCAVDQPHAGDGISIHAPRTGSDRQVKLSRVKISDFNPRSPHGERLSPAFLSLALIRFQSTLPARGATSPDKVGRGLEMISIHAPRTGSDDAATQRTRIIFAFQSTLPARGATARTLLPSDDIQRISIHAPRTGSDMAAPRRSRPTSNFNPRSPHGERPA